MKILVTGGCGFIGSNFIKSIYEKHSIINLDKMGIGANKRNISKHITQNNYKFIKGDIRNSKLLKSIIEKVDTIVNFAAETHVDRSITDPHKFLSNNVEGTVSILETIRKHNDQVRLVQISTDEVYGPRVNEPANEEDNLITSNPYAASKASADMFCQAYSKTYDIDIVITRSTNNFGPRQYPEKLIPKTINLALQNKKIPIYGSGKQVRDWIFVKDNCDAIETVMQKGKSGEIYNISAQNPYENLYVVKKILDELSKPNSLIEHTEDRPGHDVKYSIESKKIEKLGWAPQHTFEKALSTTVKWYQDNSDWISNNK